MDGIDETRDKIWKKKRQYLGHHKTPHHNIWRLSLPCLSPFLSCLATGCWSVGLVTVCLKKYIHPHPTLTFVTELETTCSAWGTGMPDSSDGMSILASHLADVKLQSAGIGLLALSILCFVWHHHRALSLSLSLFSLLCPTEQIYQLQQKNRTLQSQLTAATGQFEQHKLELEHCINCIHQLKQENRYHLESAAGN